MPHATTILARHRIAARAAAWLRRWQRRLSGRLQAGDSFARQAGWTVTPTRFGGRIYRDPRFGQLTATHAPASPHRTAPPAMGPTPPGGIAGGTP